MPASGDFGGDLPVEERFGDGPALADPDLHLHRSTLRRTVEDPEPESQAPGGRNRHRVAIDRAGRSDERQALLAREDLAEPHPGDIGGTGRIDGREVVAGAQAGFRHHDPRGPGDLGNPAGIEEPRAARLDLGARAGETGERGNEGKGEGAELPESSRQKAPRK